MTGPNVITVSEVCAYCSFAHGDRMGHRVVTGRDVAKHHGWSAVVVRLPGTALAFAFALPFSLVGIARRRCRKKRDRDRGNQSLSHVSSCAMNGFRRLPHAAYISSLQTIRALDHACSSAVPSP